MTELSDYIYSGHATNIISSSLFIIEYSPKRLRFYHWLITALATFATVSILISHQVLHGIYQQLDFIFQHYTIDIIAAYYVVTTQFWAYHTVAANQQLKTASNEKNQFRRTWWWRIFMFMEGNIDPIPRAHVDLIAKSKQIQRTIKNCLSQLRE